MIKLDLGVHYYSKSEEGVTNPPRLCSLMGTPLGNNNYYKSVDDSIQGGREREIQRCHTFSFGHYYMPQAPGASCGILYILVLSLSLVIFMHPI